METTTHITKEKQRRSEWKISDLEKCQYMYKMFLQELKSTGDPAAYCMCQKYTYLDIGNQSREFHLVKIRNWFAFWLRFCLAQQGRINVIAQIIGNRNTTTIRYMLYNAEHTILRDGQVNTPEDFAMAKWLSTKFHKMSNGSHFMPDPYFENELFSLILQTTIDIAKNTNTSQTSAALLYLNKESLQSRDRRHMVTVARGLFSVVARALYCTTYQYLGGLLGKDHSTILHQLDTFKITAQGYKDSLHRAFGFELVKRDVFNVSLKHSAEDNDIGMKQLNPYHAMAMDPTALKSVLLKKSIMERKEKAGFGILAEFSNATYNLVEMKDIFRKIETKMLKNA